MSYLAGPQTRFGLTVAAIACLLDQAFKVYLLFVFDIAANGPVRIGPFIDIILARNTGISYGLFQTQGPLGQWVLLAFKAVAVLLLWFWLARAKDRLTALSLGLIIG
ncbi:MAG: signal peptidase II, partial [Pseudolabrys sp.]